MPALNPEIMVWARETAGLTVDDAARQVGFTNTKSASAVEKLNDIECGRREPTRPQLLKMADKYRRPLLTFYLSQPPEKGERGADFRTHRAGSSPASDALLDAMLRDTKARQSMLRSVLEDEDEAEPLWFICAHDVSDGTHAVLDTLRNVLDIELGEYRAQRTATEGFELLRSRAQDAGVFVLIRSDLGNYRSALDTDVFRGITLCDPVAPFVVINGQDARSAWSFTLLHELVHLLLGQTGVGNSGSENVFEQFCDDVAGEFLLLHDEIANADLFFGDSFDFWVENINAFADQRNLSRTMVSYNALRARLITRTEYERLSAHFRDHWKQQRELERSRNRAQDGGPDYYVVQRHRVGKSLLGLVARMRSAGALSTSKAAKVLGVRPRQVQSMLDAGSGG